MQKEPAKKRKDEFRARHSPTIKKPSIAGLGSTISEGMENANHTDVVPLLKEHKRESICFCNKITKGELELFDHNRSISDHHIYELTPAEVENLLDLHVCNEKSILNWPNTGDIYIEVPSKNAPNQPQNSDKEKKEENLKINNLIYEPPTLTLTALQTNLLKILNNYYDLLYPQRIPSMSEDIYSILCMHSLNHVLRSQSPVNKIKKNTFDLPQDCKRGFIRPKVLILLPFRESAFRVVSMLSKLLHSEKTGTANSTENIINFERFVEQYSGQPNQSPDYENIFSGNTDDNFRIGLSIRKKKIKLYVDFFESDIIISSPLGIRMMESQSDKGAYDFLSSIELLVIDQAEIFFAQNWENLLHVFDVLNKQPQFLRNNDLQCVRPWFLKGWSRFYRQTVLFSSHELPEFRALFNNKLRNYHGKIRISNPIINGDICNVIVPINQFFHRIPVSDLNSVCEKRFNFFINTILPRFKDPSRGHCMIYVPSYFDFVQLRNFFKLNTISFVQICEYTKKNKITRARDRFYHSAAHFLLYSERSHFFRKIRIKGIRHLIVYQPPFYPKFYSEMVNLMQSSYQNAQDGLSDLMTVTMLYTKYDSMQLGYILGSEKAANLLKSTNATQFYGP